MKKVLLTGATGFLGSHLAEQLIDSGYELFCVLRETSNTQFIDHLNYHKVFVNWKDADLEPIIGEMDYIIHCAGVTTALNYKEYYNGNVLPTKVLLKSTEKTRQNLRRFIFISSQAAAGPSTNSIPIKEDLGSSPLTDYGKTKLLAELEALKYKDRLPLSIIRPCSIYGPRDHEFLPMFNLVKKGFKVLIGNGKKQINMIHVEDLTQLIIKSMSTMHDSGSIFFATDGEIYNWRTLYQYAEEAWDKKAFPIYLPLFIPKIIGLINDAIATLTKKPALLNSQKVKEMAPDYWLCDSSRAFSTFQFQPKYSLENGFKETLAWYQKKGWL